MTTDLPAPQMCATCGKPLTVETGWARHPGNQRTCEDRACWPALTDEDRKRLYEIGDEDA